jgi:hypothetical protein
MRNPFSFKSTRYKQSGRFTLIANTILLFVLLLNDFFHVEAATLLSNQIGQNLTLRLQDSPFVAEHDVYVHRKAKLTIEPGCELRFAKGRQLHVHGTLEARGTPDRRIKFTKLVNSFNPLSSGITNMMSNDTRGAHFEQVSGLQRSNTFRLVEGETISDGKLQVFYNSRWHYVCSTAYK